MTYAIAAGQQVTVSAFTLTAGGGVTPMSISVTLLAGAALTLS